MKHPARLPASAKGLNGRGAAAARVSQRRSGSPAHPLIDLQRLAGNAAVASLVEARREQADVVPQLAGDGALSRLLTSDLEVAAEDGAAEREAEAHERGPGAAAGTGPLVQRRSPLASGGGAPLPPALRSSMEPSLGDLGAVRLHTDADAAAMSSALEAEAFTHGTDVFAPPGASAETLRHEVAHAARHASSNQVHLKKVKKHLDFIRIKKKHTQIGKMLGAKILAPLGKVNKKIGKLAQKWEDVDHYGHWWIELGGGAGGWTPIESYGWWPEQGVGIAETLKLTRVEGKLNREGGRLDPHHGDTAEETYAPVMAVEDNAPYDAVRDEVVGQVREFATSFRGSWNWRLAWGKNCHTFVDRLKKRLGLHHQSSKRWLVGGGLAAMPLRYPTAQAVYDAITGGDFLEVTLPEFQLLTQPYRRRLLEEYNAQADAPMTWNDMNEFFEERFGPGGAIFTHNDTPLPAPQGQPLMAPPPGAPRNEPLAPVENPARTIKLYHPGWQLAGTENDPGNLELLPSPMPGVVRLLWRHGGEEVEVLAGQPDWQRFRRAHEG